MSNRTIHLITGGARSGKSRLAEQLAGQMAESSASQVVYLATATASDAEMQARIEMHQKTRPGHWTLIEEPWYLSQRIDQANQSAEPLILLVDCLTLYLSNWLCGKAPQNWPSEKQAFIQAVRQSQHHLILVSNEVGSGIIPLGQLTRQFVDEAGWLNQSVAQLADQVSLVVAGYPVSVKPDQHKT